MLVLTKFSLRIINDLVMLFKTGQVAERIVANQPSDEPSAGFNFHLSDLIYMLYIALT